MKSRQIIFLVILVSFTIFLLLQNKKITDVDAKNDTLYELGKTINEKFMGRTLTDKSCISIDGDSTSLSNLINKSKTLIYYFSELHCSSCYESQLNFIKNISSKYKLNILILGSFLSYRNYKITIDNLPVDLPIYYVNYGNFDWTIDELRVPCFFIVNKKLETSYFYAYREDVYEYNEEYFYETRKLIE